MLVQKCTTSHFAGTGMFRIFIYLRKKLIKFWLSFENFFLISIKTSKKLTAEEMITFDDHLDDYQK